MYFGTSSMTDTSVMKLRNSPSVLNSSEQNVEEDQYGHTSIAFAEYFDDIKRMIIFGVQYSGGTSKLFSFYQYTENAFTPSDRGHM